jgi:transposase
VPTGGSTRTRPAIRSASASIESIECIVWLNGCRRLHRRYERKAEHFLAVVGIPGALIYYRRSAN